MCYIGYLATCVFQFQLYCMTVVAHIKWWYCTYAIGLLHLHIVLLSVLLSLLLFFRTLILYDIYTVV